MRTKNKSIVKITSGLIIGSLIFAEFQFVLFLPQKAQADNLTSTAITTPLMTLDATSAVTSVSINEVGNPGRTLTYIVESLARGLASSLIDYVINRFVSKLIQKYKIRNFLYYDQILTNYYLNNFLRDKIAPSDPNLYKIYTLLEAGYITGQPTGTTGGPNPTKALIPLLKNAIYQYYLDSGGVDSENVYNPPATMSDQDYYRNARLYFSDPPSFTETALRGQFGAFQSSATTAAQLEVIVGNGLKASRIVGGTCSNYMYGPYEAGKDPTISPDNCKAAGGQWTASALDQARSFIDNPTAFVEKYLQSSLDKIFDTDYDPNNFWYVIGKAAGTFLFSQLSLSKGNDVLMEGGTYVPSGAPNTSSTSLTGIDLDGDNVPDGYDTNSDGIIDTCTYGGTAPSCTGSATALNPTPPAQTCLTAPSSTACNSADETALVTRVKQYVLDHASTLLDNGVSFTTYCDAFQIVKRVAWHLNNNSGQMTGLLTTPHSTQCNGYSADMIAYPDRSGVDILTSAGPPDNINGPAWQPAPPSTEPSVGWSPAQDPGDGLTSY